MLLIALALVQAAPFDTKGDYAAMARTHCRNEWPIDFQMQEFCIKGQAEGMAQFAEAGKITAIDAALRKCVEDWTKAGLPDFQMIGYCAKTQAEAYRRLNP